MTDPRIIELEPACCASTEEGRLWGDAGVFERCEEPDCAPTRYIREDAHLGIIRQWKEEEGLWKEREAALLAALNSLLSLAACDPQMGGGQWHWRPARGERVHEAIVEARRVLEVK